MYRSWKTLLISEESDLRSVERIRKLHTARSHVSLLVIIAFVLAGILSLLVAIALAATKGYLPGILMLVMAALCFLAAKLFQKERAIDPIRNFLKNPDAFEFAKAEIVSATYNPSDTRRNSRMLVQGEGKTPDGTPILFFESFSADIWPFVNAGDEENLKKGDDQYDQKGKKRTLPVPIYVIYQKRSGLNPSRAGVTAALIGIDKNQVIPRGGKT